MFGSLTRQPFRNQSYHHITLSYVQLNAKTDDVLCFYVNWFISKFLLFLSKCLPQCGKWYISVRLSSVDIEHLHNVLMMLLQCDFVLAMLYNVVWTLCADWEMYDFV